MGATSPASAQNYDVKERLVSVLSSDDRENSYYNYDEYNRVFEFMYLNYTYEMYLLHTHTYNDKGQCTSILTEQDMSYVFDPESPSFVPAYRLDYEYDSEGHIVSRDNYNREGLGMIQSAHIAYTYKNGKLTKQEQFWADELDAPFVFVEYFYDEAGQLVKEEEWQQDRYEADKYYFSGRNLYEYDDAGRLAFEYHYTVGNIYIPDQTTTLHNKYVYNYDADGNLESYEQRNARNTVESKIVFTHDKTTPAAAVAYPTSPENPVSEIARSLYKRLGDELWATDTNTMELVKSRSYTYNYEPATVGIQPAQQLQTLTLNFDAGSRQLLLNGQAEGTSVRIVSAGGQTVAHTSCTAGERLDLSHLVPGAYIAIAYEHGRMGVAQKFMVK